MKDLLKRAVVLLLEKEAKLALKKYKPRIVAITGTVGKTSTKDAVYTALSRFYFTRTAKKSFNSEFGVPLTILDLPTAWSSPVGWIKNLLNGLSLILLPNAYPEWLVLEVGADKPGDIKSVTEWLKPDITVITKLSKVPVHVEAFPSVADVFEEKGNLVKALKRGGTLILNADDEDVLAYKNLSDEKVILFGNSPDADVSARGYEVLYDEDGGARGITFKVVSEEEEYPVFLEGTLGEHHAYHVLAAFAVCRALGEHLSIAAKAFKNHEPTPGRMRIIKGVKKSLILDDTYNSSPVAAVEALNTLQALPRAKRKIAVLGDMLELGKFSIDEHKKVGLLAASAADIVVTVGVRSRYTAEGALQGGMKEDRVLQFDDSYEAGDYIQNLIQEGDALLVKGSQGVRMERVVEEIMLHPEDKETLLVRQDAQWRERNK
ncbi:MAG: UDP-N-acetylmuramoylalanyl-D-glutamyl-2,6-diaminopimelate--D-alanyl-D-alanyl ligase [Parcubacteria group bacterium]|nr:UDP-N-acetylmuramoylalanyl-D-glutamyl-2,6-diaminopimelate--D-alanyl-D-alanyl ligase [Parcubacteria group bacterium]